MAPKLDHNCIQEGPIASLATAVEMLTKSTDSLNETTKEQVKTLGVIAEQGARLNAVDARLVKVEDNQEELFGRMRTVELSQAADQGRKGKERESGQVWTYAKSTIIAGIVLAALGAYFWLLDANNYSVKVGQSVRAKK